MNFDDQFLLFKTQVQDAVNTKEPDVILCRFDHKISVTTFPYFINSAVMDHALTKYIYFLRENYPDFQIIFLSSISLYIRTREFTDLFKSNIKYLAPAVRGRAPIDRETAGDVFVIVHGVAPEHSDYTAGLGHHLKRGTFVIVITIK